MTPKIKQYLDTTRPPTPCLVVDLEHVAAQYKKLNAALPLAAIYYAVKANPARRVLETLVPLGSHFDAASAPEIEMCLAAGAAPERISYGNTIKKQSDIVRAFDSGIDLFAFDSVEELEKLAARAPGSKVYCRIVTSNANAAWPLGRKFGCELDMARDLMLQAGDMGLVPHGLSFHVGSQQTDAAQWDIAIGRCAMVFSDLREAGLDLKMLNLGGGFPVRYREDIPGVNNIADDMMKSMTRHFGNDLPKMIVEPGRSIVAEAGVIEAEVVLAARKGYGDDARWVYLDVGKFGGLAETMDEAIQYPIRSAHDGEADGPVFIAGPTCDGADVLYERSGYRLPLSLKAGDKVRILATGAYTATYASVGFNGFAPLCEHYL